MNGAASLRGRQYRGASFALLIVMALVWATAGVRWEDAVWKYVSAFPIALVSAATTRELLRCHELKALKPLRIAAAVTGIHALIYLARSFLLPWWVATHGPGVQLSASTLTMYEGVLYSILLPMTLIKLVREETHGELIRESQTDYLTRLGNRRWFFEQGAVSSRPGRARADRRAGVRPRPVQGHQRPLRPPAGRPGAAMLRRNRRDMLGPDAVLARIGGEEFAALLPGEAAHRAPALGESVARRFAETISNRVDNTRSRPRSASGWRSTSRMRRRWPRPWRPPTARSIAPRRWAKLRSIAAARTLRVWPRGDAEFLQNDATFRPSLPFTLWPSPSRLVSAPMLP